MKSLKLFPVAALLFVASTASALTVVPDSISTDTTDPQYELKEFVFTGELVRQDDNTTIYTITNSIRANTNTALAMIDKLPGMHVKAGTTRLSAFGSENLVVLVDGRQTSYDYARNINPKRIARIEVESNPVGRWADYEYVVNIVLRKNFYGYDMTLLGAGSYNLKQPHNNLEGVGVNFSTSSEYLSVYGTVLPGRGEISGADSYERTIGENTEESRYVDHIKPNNHTLTRYLQAFLGVDYKINNSHTLALQGGWDFDKTRVNNHYDLVLPIENETEHTKNAYIYSDLSGMLSYDGRFSDKLSLTADVTYNHYHVNQTYLYAGHEVSSANYTKSDKDFVSASARALWYPIDKLRLIFDEYAVYREYTNINRAVGLDDFNSRESRNRLEATARYSLNDNVSFTAGLAWHAMHESNRIGVEADGKTRMTRDKMYFLPLARIFWRFHPLWTAEAAYNSGLYYPNLDKMNTTRQMVGNDYFAEGNPDLLPEANHAVNAIVRFRRALTFRYDCSVSRNMSSTFYRVDDHGQAIRSFANCNYTNQALSVVYSKDFLNDLLNVYAQGAYRWYRISSPFTNTHKGRTWYLDLSASYTIPSPTLIVGAEYLLRHDKRPTLQGRDYGQEEFLKISLTKPLLDSRLIFQLTGEIPVAAISKVEWQKVDINGFHSVNYTDDGLNNARLKLIVQFTFGNGKSRSRESAIQTDTERSIDGAL